MSENLLTFESLSNDLLINIFQYVNTPDLFNSFYNLNIRLNTLIQSLPHHHLTISKDSSHLINYNIYSPYIHSLILIGEVNINLNDFTNLHRLILHYPSEKILNEFSHNHLSNLEYLSIPDLLFRMSFIFQKIFSNQYPKLKSCYLFGYETIETILPWTQTISLRYLHIGLIDYHVYKSILSSCPNLYSFKLTIFQSYLKLSHIYSHSNLKKLEISSDINDWYYNDQLIHCFIECVPNLEELIINRTISVSKLVELIPDYDWLSSIITLRLRFLKYFSFCLQLEFHLEFIDFISIETRRQLRSLFLNTHQNRYQARFIIK